MGDGRYGEAGLTESLSELQMEGGSTSGDSSRPDEVLSVIGEIGRWQVRQALLLSWVGLPVAFTVLCINFMAPPTEYWCAPPNDQWDPGTWHDLGIPPKQSGSEGGLSQCRSYPANSSAPSVSIVSNNRTVACGSWSYNISDLEVNVISEWDLVCTREWLQMMAQGAVMMGVACGVVFWGPIADRFGRRPSLLICIVVTTVMSLGVAAVHDVNAFLVLRSIVGFFGIGAYITGFVLCMELVGDRWRVLFGILFCVPMSLGFMTLSLLAYYVRHWRHLQVIISLSGLPLFSFYWLAPESARWLLSQGRADEARCIMEKICHSNGKPIQDKITPMQASSSDVRRPREGCLSLLTSGRMMSITACMFFCWFVNSLVYYGILLNTADFGGDIYMNAFLMGLVELPAYAVCIYAVYRLGRRPPIIFTMIGAGASCLLTMAFEKGSYRYDWPIVCLALLGKFNITASFGTIYIYTAELYPTSVRNTGLALCTVGTRIGGILAPFLTLLHPGIPVLVFGATSILSGVSILLLPETANKVLPEVIADVLRSSRRSPPNNREEEQALRH